MYRHHAQQTDARRTGFTYMAHYTILYDIMSPVTFARLSSASFMSHLPAPPPCRAGPSPWLALWYGIIGMVSHWLSGHFLEYSPRNSLSNLHQHYSAALGL